MVAMDTLCLCYINGLLWILYVCVILMVAMDTLCLCYINGCYGYFMSVLY